MDRANYGVADANHIETKALPNGAATVNSDGFDLGTTMTARGALLVACELQIEAPTLATADLGDADTMKYHVQMDTVSNFASPTTIALEVLVQTGAGGVGAAAANARFRLPTNCERYVRVAAVNSAAGDASDKSMTLSLFV